MAVTTDAATIGVMNLRQYLAKNPSIPSNSPPTIKAPTMAFGP